MGEAEVVERLIGYTDMLIAGLSAFFTVVSAYVAGLNYFVRRASLFARIGAFGFFSFVFMMLCAVLYGAQVTHKALVDHLAALGAAGELSSVGRALVSNALTALPGSEGATMLAGVSLSIDRLVMTGVWGGMALTYVVLFMLTFNVRWGEGREP